MKRVDVGWLLALNLGVIGAMWVFHGGPARSNDLGGVITSFGQLAGLAGALSALIGLLMMSRAPWLERLFGMDRMAHWHRLIGFTTVSLLGGHVVLITIGYAIDAHLSLWAQIVDSVLHYPNLVLAIVGFGLMLALAGMSIRAIRGRISYETWWFIHLGAYAAVALAFAHQFSLGADFVDDWWARVYWSLLWLSVAGSLILYRWVLPVVAAYRHRLRVVDVAEVGPDVVTISLGGRGLDRLAAQAGQFFILRILTRGQWWKAHPFSLSAPPDGTTLRFTVKALGDDTTAMQTIAVGTPIAVEGPYGGFLSYRPTGRKVLFVAGGIGITPFRGILDDLSRPAADVTLIYRARSPEDAVFLDELTALSAERGFRLVMSYSRWGDPDPHPFAPERLLAVAPDLADREAFVVGSPSMISTAAKGLRAAGMPVGHIHLENFVY